ARTYGGRHGSGALVHRRVFDWQSQTYSGSRRQGWGGRAMAKEGVVAKDLRTFIAEIMERRPDELKMVTEEVDGRFGVTAVAQALERRGQFPAVYFQRVRGSELPVVVNLPRTYQPLTLALGT